MKEKLDELIRFWEEADRIRKVRALLGAVIVLLTLILLILLIGGRKQETAEGQGGHLSDTAKYEEAAVSVVESTKESEAEPVSQAEAPVEEVSLTITAAGDLTVGRDSNAPYDMSFDEAWDNNEPGWFLDNVRSYFAFDDLTIVNFEGTLTESDEQADKTFTFKAPASYSAVLTEGSVEAVNLANNHSFDFGQSGYADTKAALEEAGVVSFGYDRSAVMEVKGIKIGLIGILEFYYSYEENEALLLQEIGKVKAEGAQLIIVSFHWGDEKSYYPYNEQIQLAHAAIDNGADLVIGHHPHVIQNEEVYNGRHICYSLGNFCFGGNVYPFDMDAVIYQQKFIFRDGVLQPDDIYQFVPIRISSESDYNNYQPTPVDGAAADRIREKLAGNYEYSE
ncbi:MAG: CapA family protein [Lachnospiraceae bacterium]|nr:CapA family protein [Lachnospiraceae bacterium]